MSEGSRQIQQALKDNARLRETLTMAMDVLEAVVVDNQRFSFLINDAHQVLRVARVALEQTKESPQSQIAVVEP